MPAKDNLTKTTNSTATPRAIDFVSRFSASWEALMNILGITRMIEKVPGQTMKVVKASVTLTDGTQIGEGEEIPYSIANITEEPIGEATFEKYAKAVSIELINKNGYDVAVEKTDNAFLAELQKRVKNRMYTFLNTGLLTATDTTFQMALAMSKGRVLDAFSAMGLESTEVVAFVNILDFYQYLGGATISTQTAFGMTYVQDFLGYRVIFLCNDSEVARNTIVATPVENMVAYYINPATSDFARAGLEFTVDGETPILGFHTEGDYRTLVSENTAIMGLYLFAEYLNAIAVETIEASGSIGTATIASAAGTTAGTKITVSAPTLTEDMHLYYISATSPTAPAYLSQVDSTWTEFEVDANGVIDNLEVTGSKILVAITNGAGQFIYASSATTVTNKS